MNEHLIDEEDKPPLIDLYNVLDMEDWDEKSSC